MKYINRRPAGSPALPALFKRDILANGKDILGRRFNVSRFLLSGDIDFSCGVVTTLLSLVYTESFYEEAPI